MAINQTSRKETLVGNASSNQVFTVPFECENASDISVYDPSGNRMLQDTHYTVTNNTMPGVSSNTITVTWIGTSPSGTITFYRNSPRTQTVSLVDGFAGGDLEKAFDRLTLAGQNPPRQGTGNIDAASSRITSLGEPTSSQDASTIRYAQEVYSKKGYISPPVGNTDDDKALYAQSTTSYIWKDPFDIPYPTATAKVLQVNGLGDPVWIDPPEYAPVYPTDEPKYLSVTSEDEAWRTVKQLPSLAKGNVGDTLVYQEDDKVAWRPIRWLPGTASSRRYLYNSTGTGADGAVSGVVTNSTIAAAKATTIWENHKDYNQGGSWDCWIKGDLDGHRIPLLEFDCSALSAADYTVDSIIHCRIRFRFTAAATGSTRTFVVKRLKNTFVEGTGETSNSYNDDGASWNKPTAPGGSPDWNWGSGVFEPDFELDHELPVPTLQVGADTETSDYTYVDITHLFLDAIKNRSGILRLAIYDPSDNSTSLWTRFYANAGHTHQVQVEISRSNARKAYWQPWNYKHIHEQPLVGEETANFTVNPHVCRARQMANQIGLMGGHQVSSGKVAACGYAVSHETGAIYYARTEMLHTFVSNNQASVGSFLDFTNSGDSTQATGVNGRVATIWLADEPNE